MIINKFTLQIREDTPSENVAKAIAENRVGRGKSRADFYITGVEDNTLTICEISGINASPLDALAKFLAKNEIIPTGLQCREITVKECADLISEGEDNNICPELPEAFGRCGMMPFVSMPFSSAITEMQCVEPPNASEAVRAAKQFQSASLKEEIERIYKGKNAEFCGHPVMYSVCMDNKADAQDVAGLIVSSLYACGRLKANRAAILNLERMPLPNELIDDLYRAQGGSAILVKIPKFKDEPEKTEITNKSLKHICENATECRDSVLTIFLGTSSQKGSVDKIENDLGQTALYQVVEDKAAVKEAERRLKLMAKSAGCKSVAGLCKELTEGKEYSESELKSVFSKWYDGYLRTKAYPEYAAVIKKKDAKVNKETPESSAFDELSCLIGLKDAKKILAQARDFAKAQKIYQKHGFSNNMPCLHMAFCGNPGTAKTTVARLTAKIFKECGVLDKGNLVEVSRSDLIGKYVGWTAKAVSEKFKEAEGSVLFIDEAYSLLEEKEGMFGDEAINQITLEMENHRDNVVVIFAGYKEPMEEFLNRNAGLKSRVAFKVDFPDYTEDEMMGIFRMNLNQNARQVTAETEDKIRKIIRDNMKDPHYGNGRFARELVEHAMLSQASRIVSIPEDKVTDDAIRYLISDDFTVPEKEIKAEVRTIGFTCG